MWVEVGQPWLDEERLSLASGGEGALTRILTHRAMEANCITIKLLAGGITVEGLPD